MDTLSATPTSTPSVHPEIEQARKTLENFLREWVDEPKEVFVCEYLLGLVEEQEDWATRREKLVSGSIWVSVGECYAVSAGTFHTSSIALLPEGIQVTFLFKSNIVVSLRTSKDESLSYSMPIQQFLNMFKPVDKKKAGKKKAASEKGPKK